MRQKVIFTLDELKERLVYWQKVLRLQDWEIEIQFQHYVSINEYCAQASYSAQYKRARIDIASEESYGSLLMPIQDMEQSLVHELLHLHFANFADGEDSPLVHRFKEQAIDLIACSLVELERKEG